MSKRERDDSKKVYSQKEMKRLHFLLALNREKRIQSSNRSSVAPPRPQSQRLAVRGSPKAPMLKKQKTKNTNERKGDER